MTTEGKVANAFAGLAILVSLFTMLLQFWQGASLEQHVDEKVAQFRSDSIQPSLVFCWNAQENADSLYLQNLGAGTAFNLRIEIAGPDGSDSTAFRLQPQEIIIPSGSAVLVRVDGVSDNFGDIDGTYLLETAAKDQAGNWHKREQELIVSRTDGRWSLTCGRVTSIPMTAEDWVESFRLQ